MHGSRNFGIKISIQNLFQKEIKKKLDSVNATIQSRTIILSAVLDGSVTWVEHRLRVLGNRMLRRIFEPEKVEVAEGGENCIMSSIITFTLRKMYSG
jgi:hypothetical protein